MLEALRKTEIVAPSQRFREACPEITLEGLCGGRGEGFHRLLDHFCRENPELDENGELKAAADYPLLRHERQWQILNLDHNSDVPLSRGERAFQASRLRRRTSGRVGANDVKD